MLNCYTLFTYLLYLLLIKAVWASQNTLSKPLNLCVQVHVTVITQMHSLITQSS